MNHLVKYIRPLSMANNPNYQSLGLMYGQVIGDALGARYEFEDAEGVAAKIHNDRDKTGFLPLLGGGAWKMEPGQVTDDSEMALGLTRSLLKEKGYNQAKVATVYCRWVNSKPPDIGNNTLAALTVDINKSEEDILQQVLHNVDKFCVKSRSNGSLMRQSPLVLPYVRSGNISGLLDAVELDTALTHKSPLIFDANKVYATALHSLLSGASPQAAYDAALAACKIDEVKMTLLAAKHNIIHKDAMHIGYVLVALQTAFYSLLNAKDFESGLVNIINIGGDTDTNGCIGGAMLGARFGADSIPNQWKSTVVNARPRRLKTYPEADCSNIKSLTERLLELQL